MLQSSPPRYSLIIPVYNGMPYLKACVESIISQDFDDYELIISNDHSTDESAIYLESLKHPRVRIVAPDAKMSMTEHWEWALSFATGDWQMFVGQDDGLQRYFFEAAEGLCSAAENKGIRAVCSKRAYYFWPGCEEIYSKRVNYRARRSVVIKNSKKAAFGAVIYGSYHELPQMYGSSLFHRELIDEARSLQNGNVFCCHPQDANLAAVACSLEGKYLQSGIPLGWVGTSPKSAGLAISSSGLSKGMSITKATKDLRDEYTNKVNSSKYEYGAYAGDFGFADVRVYFWQALMRTSALQSKKMQRTVRSRLLRYAIFSAARGRLIFGGSSAVRLDMLRVMVEVNTLNSFIVAALGFMFNLLSKISRLVRLGGYEAPLRFYEWVTNKCVSYSVRNDEILKSKFKDVCEEVDLKIQASRWLK